MMRFALFILAIFTLAAPATAQTRPPTQGYADIVARLTPAVVNIATTQRVAGMDQAPQFPPGSPLQRFNQDLDQAAQTTSLGSGFIISADGVIVTNNHVIEEADTIQVILQDGTQSRADVVGRDIATDVAVLRIHARGPLPFVNFGNSDVARVGDIVLAIGNPFGLGGSLSVGVVSARNRNIDAGRYDDFIQTDAAINRGNSGGPLFNLNGEVIGVNTAIVSPTGGSVGVGFATPSSIVKPIVDQLLRYGEVRRGWLGVRLSNVDSDIAGRLGLARPQGAFVTRVTPDGPAARAGMRPGDVVLKFGGQDVADSRALTRFVGGAQIGGHVAIEVLRDGRRQVLDVVIARLEEQQASAGAPAPLGDDGEMRRDGGPRSAHILGVNLSELDASLREEFQIEPSVRGLIVLAVSPDEPADGKLKPGDVIEQIGFQHVDTVAAARAIAVHAADRAIVVRINRDGAVTFRSLRGS
ncbi:MAG: Do family serine endopeptidase [Alphaproteobacteria bacterium]